MKLNKRMDKVAEQLDKRRAEPFRILRLIVTPETEVIGACFQTSSGLRKIDRMAGESESDFRTRALNDLKASGSDDLRPIIPMTPDDENL